MLLPVVLLIGSAAMARFGRRSGHGESFVAAAIAAALLGVLLALGQLG